MQQPQAAAQQGDDVDPAKHKKKERERKPSLEQATVESDAQRAEVERIASEDQLKQKSHRKKEKRHKERKEAAHRSVDESGMQHTAAAIEPDQVTTEEQSKQTTDDGERMSKNKHKHRESLNNLIQVTVDMKSNRIVLL